MIFRQRNELGESLTHYQQAATLTTDNTTWRVMALQNLSWILYETDQFAAGDRYLDEAAEILADSDSRDLQLNQILTRALGATLRGDYAGALNFCNEVLSPDTGANETHQAWATWIMARCAYGVGRPDEAQRRLAETALVVAMKVQDPRLMNYVTDLRRRLRNK